jgi:predicted phosphodiesterase
VRYLILSDLHANLHALDAVLAEVRGRRFQKILVLGDLVGYGAYPNEVVERVMALKRLEVVIRGNHDRVAAGTGEENAFNLPAMAAILWTRDQLSPGTRKALTGLTVGPRAVEDFAVCHGSPFDEDLYILSEREAWVSFQSAQTDLTFFGHSHIPCIFSLQRRSLEGWLVGRDYLHYRLKPGVRYLVNPGSVGQPRDGNPKASYCIYDSKHRTVSFFRVPYPVHPAQEAILKAGLPTHLAQRLATGQ